MDDLLEKGQAKIVFSFWVSLFLKGSKLFLVVISISIEMTEPPFGHSVRLLSQAYIIGFALYHLYFLTRSNKEKKKTS